MMIGKIFITRSGYDPKIGKHVKDPYLGSRPSFGACRPDIRKKVNPGDHIFVISGKVRGSPEKQFVIGGFEVEQKITMQEAFHMFPEQRLHRLDDGQLDGNVISNEAGAQHELDDHKNFGTRTTNYIIGKAPLVLVTDEEIRRGREETIGILQDILEKDGERPIDLVGRWGTSLKDKQVLRMRDWLEGLKKYA